MVLDGVAHDSPIQPFHLMDRGLTLGDGLFETLPVFAGKPFLMAEHLARLSASAERLKLIFPLKTVVQSIEILAEKATGHGVIRVMVTRGPGQRGLALPHPSVPGVIATLAPWSASMAGKPIRLATVSIRRNPTSPASTMKTLAYLDNVMALDEAAGQGFDDALMLNTAGRVASTTMANLFVLSKGRLITPPPSEGILPGIMRGFVLDHAARLGLQPEVRPVEVAEILAADEVFATNSVRLVLPVIELDGQPVATGAVASGVLDLVCEAALGSTGGIKAFESP